MRVRANLALAAILIVAGFFAFSAGIARADVSQALRSVLSEMRGLSRSDFDAVTVWARNGAPQPFMTAFQPQQTEGDILNLGSDDRHAVLYWLRGSGRSALYARGATDSEIGSRDPRSGPVPTPTPNPWRNLPLATASLDGNVQGSIKVIGGFAAARRDGHGAIACVSFENVSTRVASEVVFEFPLLSEAGNELGKLTLDRTGTFSPNIGIYTFGSLSDWQNGSMGPGSRNDNCIRRDLGTAALPIIEARLVGYRVTKVVYSDGTSWTP